MNLIRKYKVWLLLQYDDELFSYIKDLMNGVYLNNIYINDSHKLYYKNQKPFIKLKSKNKTILLRWEYYKKCCIKEKNHPLEQINELLIFIINIKLEIDYDIIYAF